MALASDGSWLTALVDAVVGLMNLIGAPGAGLAIALENLFPPLPSEVILPMAGLAAARGSFTLVEALAWTTAGSVAGAFALYAVGAWLGIDRLRALVRRMPLLKLEDVDRTVAWFARHGGKAVFFGRMLPIFRSLISIPAGVTRMPLWRFGMLTLAGSFIWNAVFVMSGYLLGDQWHVVEEYAGVLQYAVIAVAAAALVWFMVNRVRQLRSGAVNSDPA
ncbi:DedA family protein [Microbacterium sp. VKM Ac-2870]|uniref:DedA family protein n=1 Tax=Microbacterium sp. VKM Ac-2870 TaxID=2783825 RepID=UPI00188C3271|nr:DedA family protein [Microbacterium sp. VKM Ac-2870]MBF4562002.1 DedA family protein [Microbacterium sp. VKM Ac-2870]